MLENFLLITEKQLEEAESTIEEGTLKNVLKMPLNLFTKQLAEVTIDRIEQGQAFRLFRAMELLLKNTEK